MRPCTNSAVSLHSAWAPWTLSGLLASCDSIEGCTPSELREMEERILDPNFLCLSSDVKISTERNCLDSPRTVDHEVIREPR